MCGTTGILKKNVRQNWIPIVQSKSGSAAHAAGESQSKSAGAGRDGPNIRYCVPLKIPNIRYCVPTEIPENPQSNAVPAGPPPAGKIPNPTPTGRTAAGRKNPQTKSASVCCLLLSSPHGKAGSAGKHILPILIDLTKYLKTYKF